MKIGNAVTRNRVKRHMRECFRMQLPYLKKGYYADLTVFDEEKLRNGVPDQEKPFGIEKVFINGRMIMIKILAKPTFAIFALTIQNL